MERQAASFVPSGEAKRRRSQASESFGISVHEDSSGRRAMSTAQKSINSLLQTHVDLIFKWTAGKRSTAASWRGKMSMNWRHVAVGASEK